MFVSDYFELEDERYEQFIDMGVFDALLDKDSSFFINVIRLKKNCGSRVYGGLSAFK